MRRCAAQIRKHPYDQIIQKFPQTQTITCVSPCVWHVICTHMSENEIQEQVQQIHASAGFDSNHKVSLSDVSKSEQRMGIKVLVFHHNHGTKNSVRTRLTSNPIQKQFGCIYTKIITTRLKRKQLFLGARIFVSTATRVMWVKHITNAKFFCNVCLSTECHKYPDLKLMHCKDCRCICKSAQCFHKYT